MARLSRGGAAVLAAGLVVALATPGNAAPKRSTTSVAGTAAAIHVVTKKRVSARLIKYTVSTPSLARSTTTPLRVNILLPKGYAEHPKKRYPVLYALPGTSNLADVWLSNLKTAQLTKKRPMIVVMPDGTYNADGGGFYTNWVDQTTKMGVANWETFHTAELVTWIDQKFRTRAKRSQRAILGISQGGFGSMSYAARHPKTFGIAASFSGAVDIYYNPICEVGASLLISVIMTGLNGVQPFAPFGDPITNSANWIARDPASQVKKLAHTKVDLYTSTGLPGKSDLTDPAMVGTATLEGLLHVSNLCFKQAAQKAGVSFGWHSYAQGTHAWNWGVRSLKDYLPRLMRYFKAGS